MSDNNLLYEYIDRLDMLSEEISKFRRAFESIQNGTPIDIAFNDEIYMEKYEEAKCKAYSAKIMEHILKMKYSTGGYTYYDQDIKHWGDKIRNFKKQMYSLTNWFGHKDKNCINYINKNIQDFYNNAVGMYHGDIDKNKHLEENEKYIPEECPWTFEDLLDKKIPELLSMLPDPKEE